MTDNHLLTDLCATIDALAPALLALQRDLHAHPELSRGEVRTTGRRRARCSRGPASRTRALPVSGLVADLGAEQPAYRVALRADLDALPVGERTGVPVGLDRPRASATPAGTTCTWRRCSAPGWPSRSTRTQLRERGIGVRLLFQPAEEVIPGGAVDLIAEGALDGVDAIFARALRPEPRRRQRRPARRARSPPPPTGSSST